MYNKYVKYSKTHRQKTEAKEAKKERERNEKKRRQKEIQKDNIFIFIYVYIFKTYYASCVPNRFICFAFYTYFERVLSVCTYEYVVVNVCEFNTQRTLFA